MNTIPRPEHPRPYFQREQWLNLNGPWRFAFDPQAVGEPNRWYLPHSKAGQKSLTINVPFPWESKLSGVERPDYKGVGWYEREITIPKDWHGLVPYLNFEAVDWLARVWINGQLVAEHDNGYLPFSIDLSEHVQPGETATVTVRAYDIAEGSTMVGKQVPFWYIHSSGIWQTVWLEGRQPNHITAICIEPDVAQEQAIIKLKIDARIQSGHMVTISSKDGAFPTKEVFRDIVVGEQETELTLDLPNPKLWSPDDPNLYDIDISLGGAGGGERDTVSTYFGMRTVERGPWNGNDYEYILLNGEPVYLRGALDQGFHPDGVHSYPSDDIIRGDIELAKELGLNMLRCHIKINDPRYYYWADRLGLLIMYDFPCPVLDTPAMRRMFEAAMPRVIERDFNSPSIIAWILFNETWGLSKQHTAEGQQWLYDVTNHARALDPTRLIEDNSVCNYDHVETDINSWHYYINDYQQVRRHIQRVVDDTYPGSDFNYVGGDYVQKTAPLMNSEYGGISARMGDQDISWCFKYQTTELRRHNKICGYVYTELDDIEWEHNGFVNYDRGRKEFGYDFFVEGMSVADLNSADVVGFDVPPCQTLAPGANFTTPLFVSHWGSPMTQAKVRWQLDFVDRFGERRQDQQGEITCQPNRFAVSDLEPLSITLPNENGLAILAVILEDDTREIRCRNYVTVEVRSDAGPNLEATDRGYALRFKPGDIHRLSSSWPRAAITPEKFSVQGSGWVDYVIDLPPDLNLNNIKRLKLRFEASARAGMAKVDWPQRTYGLNYPQTEVDKKYPTDLQISVNNISIGQAHLPDDPADGRGTLSHHYQIDPGSYGFLTDLVAEGAVLANIIEAVKGQSALTIRFEIPGSAAQAGGLVLYGETRGCYPIAPTLFIEST
ncbi:MAG: sugar-binding domain-containing protein [Chloroflexota bacterium]